MATYQIRDGVPAWITWIYEIEAESEEEARERFYDRECGYEIGDNIDWPGDFSITQLPKSVTP